MLITKRIIINHEIKILVFDNRFSLIRTIPLFWETHSKKNVKG